VIKKNYFFLLPFFLLLHVKGIEIIPGNEKDLGFDAKNILELLLPKQTIFEIKTARFNEEKWQSNVNKGLEEWPQFIQDFQDEIDDFDFSSGDLKKIFDNLTEKKALLIDTIKTIYKSQKDQSDVKVLKSLLSDLKKAYKSVSDSQAKLMKLKKSQERKISAKKLVKMNVNENKMRAKLINDLSVFAQNLGGKFNAIMAAVQGLISVETLIFY
jgi:hypothetical protein